MKYLDRNGKAHGSWHKAIVADIKSVFEPAGKRELLDSSPDGTRYQVPESYYYEGHPVPPTTPVARVRQPEFDGDAQKISKLEIDYDSARILVKNPQGEIIGSSAINERLLYGLAAQVMQEDIEKIGEHIPDDDLIKMSTAINILNDDAINRVVAAASGKNCVLSPAFSDEFINCAAKHVTTALDTYPLAVKTDADRFIPKILSDMEEVINERLAPKESDSTEPKG